MMRIIHHTMIAKIQEVTFAWINRKPALKVMQLSFNKETPFKERGFHDYHYNLTLRRSKWSGHERGLPQHNTSREGKEVLIV